jgi:F-type H+-transporting ATPase subunit gamma
VGSERGFCGDFNRAVTTRLEDAIRVHDHADPAIIAVGHKLHPLLETNESVVAFLDGASVVEEVTTVLERLTDELNALRVSTTAIVLYGIYHDGSDVMLTPLLPPFAEEAGSERKHAFAPLLNVAPEIFLRDLVDHYLFAALNNMLYASLMAENQRRVSHLEGAVRHLDQESEELTRKCRALRQEEIVEEIEVILLSATGVGGDTEAKPQQR